MKIKFTSLFTIIFFLIIFFLFYKGLKNTNIYVPNVDLKKDIPIFKANYFDSSQVKESNEIFKKNKFYLMNIWASWCIPCKKEHPFLLKLSEDYNIEIVGLNYKDNEVNAKKFLEELNNPYKVILTDKDGTVAIEWGAYGVPESFLIYDQKIIKKYIGPLNKNSLIEIKGLIQ